MNSLKIPHTPFTVITINADDEKGTFIAVGNKRITELISKEVADKKIKYRDWDIITSVISIIVEAIIDEREEITRGIEKLKTKNNK
ncbi:MAG: hypothetical protein [Microvirus sp.]|nr:MAG: hypothetical protein [Microvirus sp.]